MYQKKMMSYNVFMNQLHSPEFSSVRINPSAASQVAQAGSREGSCVSVQTVRIVSAAPKRGTIYFIKNISGLV